MHQNSQDDYSRDRHFSSPGRGKHYNFRGDPGVDAVQAELRALNSKVLENETTILSLRSQITQKNEQLSFLTDEKIVSEEALEASQRECKQLTSLIKELDDSVTEVSKVLAARTKERDDALCAERRESDLQKKYTSLEHKLNKSLAKEKELLALLDDCKEGRRQDEIKIESLASNLRDKQLLLEATEREVDDLKSLATQLDATREQLVDKLQATMADQQEAETRMARMERDFKRMSEEGESRNTEVLHLHALVETLGKERDHIESELQLYIETHSQVKDENKRLVADGLLMQKELKQVEKAYQEETLCLQQAETKVSSLKEQLSVETSARKLLEDRCGTKTAELQNLTEDFTRLTCDQQVLKSEIRQMVLERDSLVDEFTSLESRLHYSEQVISAKEKEEKETALSYQKLCDDYQRAKLGIIDLDTQNRQLRFQLQSLDEVHYAAQERIKSLEEDLHNCATELKNMERETDKHSRALTNKSSLLKEGQRERSDLAAQVTNLRQVAIDMEQKHENLSRDMGALEAQNRILTDVLQERAQEIETLASRYRLEQDHVREVEKLLSHVRAQEHKWEVESKEADSKSALMRERQFALEEQVKMLQATRDAQNKEIMRLQSAARAPSPVSRNHSLGRTESQQEACAVQAPEHQDPANNKTYKDCLDRLQRTETLYTQQKRDYDHMLELLAKVDEERTHLQRKCSELLIRTSPREDLLQSRGSSSSD